MEFNEIQFLRPNHPNVAKNNIFNILTGIFSKQCLLSIKYLSSSLWSIYFFKNHLPTCQKAEEEGKGWGWRQ